MKQIEKIKTTNWQGNAPHTMWCRLADKINELVDAFNSLASQGEKESVRSCRGCDNGSFLHEWGTKEHPRPPFQGECNACKPHVCASSVGFGCLCIHSCQKEQPSPGWGLNKSDSPQDANAQYKSSLIKSIEAMRKGKAEGSDKEWEIHYQGYDEALDQVIKLIQES